MSEILGLKADSWEHLQHHLKQGIRGSIVGLQDGFHR
jgi:hypothetical protein